mmetsp:Transcript_26534/g.4649  ORF Transcript_26534/g.4649 Transcript_26534/m.4649 type:complete len:154 (+) Transcript_26534:841-1302(+)
MMLVDDPNQETLSPLRLVKQLDGSKTVLLNNIPTLDASASIGSTVYEIDYRKQQITSVSVIENNADNLVVDVNVTSPGKICMIMILDSEADPNSEQVCEKLDGNNQEIPNERFVTTYTQGSNLTMSLANQRVGNKYKIFISGENLQPVFPELA